MLFTLMLLAGSESAAQGTQTLAGALTALGLFACGKRLGSPRGGLYAAALWLGSPLVLRMANVACVDAGVALFSAMAATSLLAWFDSRERAWLAVAASFGGLAAASKYTGLAIVGLCALVVLISSGRGRLAPPASVPRVAAL